MARPQDLHADLAAVKDAGVDTIISLLEPAEAAAVGLSREAQVCASLDITFLNHPIRDMHLPDPAAFQLFATDIAARMRRGAQVAVHCHASIGRSGMLACTTLGHFGYTAPTALAHVSKMRGVPVPDTTEQAAFIRQIMTPQA